MIMITVL